MHSWKSYFITCLSHHGYLEWTGWPSYQPWQPLLPSRPDSCSPLLQISPEFSSMAGNTITYCEFPKHMMPDEFSSTTYQMVCHFLPSFPSIGQFCPHWACCPIHPSSSAFPSWPPPLKNAVQFKLHFTICFPNHQQPSFWSFSQAQKSQGVQRTCLDFQGPHLEIGQKNYT